MAVFRGTATPSFLGGQYAEELQHPLAHSGSAAYYLRYRLAGQQRKHEGLAMATIGGAQASKNILERSSGTTVDSAGLSGADLEQKKLLKMAITSVGAGKDGAYLNQAAAGADFEIEVTD